MDTERVRYEVCLEKKGPGKYVFIVYEDEGVVRLCAGNCETCPILADTKRIAHNAIQGGGLLTIHSNEIDIANHSQTYGAVPSEQMQPLARAIQRMLEKRVCTPLPH